MPYDSYNEPERIFTPDLLQLVRDAQDLWVFDIGYEGFTWDMKAQDQCSEEPYVHIEKITILGDEDADVAMRYVDGTCANDPYTLHLHQVDGKWLIDDVEWTDDGTPTSERREAEDYIEEMIEQLMEMPAKDVMARIRELVPTTEELNDPDSELHDNPAEIEHRAVIMEAIKECFEQNPAYTAAMGKEIERLAAKTRSLVK